MNSLLLQIFFLLWLHSCLLVATFIAMQMRIDLCGECVMNVYVCVYVW